MVPFRSKFIDGFNRGWSPVGRGGNCAVDPVSTPLGFCGMRTVFREGPQSPKHWSKCGSYAQEKELVG